jgi:pyruvate dehydrogenase E1 component alpha subunit
MRCLTADGNDAVAVFMAMQESVSQARRGDGPTFLVFDTYRWLEHCGPAFDNHIGYRTEEEYATWRIRCPIDSSRAGLRGLGLLSSADEEIMVSRLRREIDSAFEFAKNSPLPEHSTAFDHVYA